MTGVEAHTGNDTQGTQEQGENMQAVIEALPTYDDQTREDLITETARLALNIERAERANDAATEAGQRVQYHTAMAELLARTESFNKTAQGQVAANRREHLRLAAAYQRELEQLRGGV